ncbi:hypothetical protein D9M68_995090 [compost metagenome]
MEIGIERIHLGEGSFTGDIPVPAVGIVSAAGDEGVPRPVFGYAQFDLRDA